jgi:hypothetical protein
MAMATAPMPHCALQYNMQCHAMCAVNNYRSNLQSLANRIHIHIAHSRPGTRHPHPHVCLFRDGVGAPQARFAAPGGGGASHTTSLLSEKQATTTDNASMVLEKTCSHFFRCHLFCVGRGESIKCPWFVASYLALRSKEHQPKVR